MFYLNDDSFISKSRCETNRRHIGGLHDEVLNAVEHSLQNNQYYSQNFEIMNNHSALIFMEFLNQLYLECKCQQI